MARCVKMGWGLGDHGRLMWANDEEGDRRSLVNDHAEGKFGQHVGRRSLMAFCTARRSFQYTDALP